MARTHYEVLGVDASAAMADIKSAFRTLAKRLHPDVSKLEKSQAETQFKEIQAAHEILSDPTRRAQYDLSLRHGKNYAEPFLDTMSSQMSAMDIFQGSPVPKKKQKRYGKKRRKRNNTHDVADVELGAIPDGALDDDDTLGGIF